ncbi:MAG TPA: hypothetical protein PLL57_15030 [Flavobacteriales bacterium]|nr:hypothetical protein [Flavobacteriales bacterium]
MRLTTILLTMALSPCTVSACTAFVTTHDGHTYIGNNEDSWCIEGRIRFVPGAPGNHGAVYFSTWKGHPFIPWLDQLGMNEAGLVFDGLAIQPKDVASVHDKKAIDFTTLGREILEHCADVPEALRLLGQYDLTFLHRSMLFLADAQGRHAVVQNDTVLTGQEADLAVGNWRLGCGEDPDGIPIQRLQTGRALLKAGIAPTWEGAVSVLESMKARREFLGNGTFFSTLFEPDQGRVHVYFYHDFTHSVVFDLHDELSKGEHALDLPSLFPPNAEFQALQGYRTPFHQRWLFWTLATIAALSVLIGLAAGAVVIRVGVLRLRKKSTAAWWPAFLAGCAMLIVVALVGIFLTMEAVFYFGLADLNPALVVLPFALLFAGTVLAMRIRRSTVDRWLLVPSLALMLPVLALCTYWGLFWP